MGGGGFARSGLKVEAVGAVPGRFWPSDWAWGEALAQPQAEIPAVH